MGKKYNTVYCT